MFPTAKSDTILRPVEKDFEANGMWTRAKSDAADLRSGRIHKVFVLQNAG
jgi:hypothetical protein